MPSCSTIPSGDPSYPGCKGKMNLYGGDPPGLGLLASPVMSRTTYPSQALPHGCCQIKVETDVASRANSIAERIRLYEGALTLLTLPPCPQPLNRQ